MKPRSCIVRVWIANDAGLEKCYSLKPLAAAQLPQSAVAGFRLTHVSDGQQPVYHVTIFVDGQTGCNCPQGAGKGVCKHSDALTAAGILPSAVIGLLQERTRQLAATETEAQRLAEAAVEERKVHEHDAQWAHERIADLTATVANLHERALQLQTALAAIPPARPRRTRKVKAQAA